MPTSRKAHDRNPWKVATFSILGVLAAASLAGVVVANYRGGPDDAERAAETAATKQTAGDAPVADSAPARERPPVRYAAVQPSAADIDACNRYASSAASGNKTTETFKDALLGGAIGAGVGAAGGAIAGGGKGAGKGAGIGGIVGATAGTLYGLNQANQSDARAAQAYRDCMRQRGFN